MARESSEARQARCLRCIEALERSFPEAKCALRHENPLQLLVATILSAQCTDVRVNRVTPDLFAKYPTARAFAEAPRRDIERAIHSTGFFRAKSKSIQGACRRIVDGFNGEVPRTMEELTSLPGIGRKTANVILGTAFGIAEGVVVDTHVHRLSHRLGFSRAKTPEKIEIDLCRLVPGEKWIEFSHLLILHGRGDCNARRPKCGGCVLRGECLSAEKFLAEEAGRVTRSRSRIQGVAAGPRSCRPTRK
ncbi:MAG: endonuclease III [Planctomycetes bacterium]|nr:endonuclease III [Planctomycetota bacterium]